MQGSPFSFGTRAQGLRRGSDPSDTPGEPSKKANSAPRSGSFLLTGGTVSSYLLFLRPWMTSRAPPLFFLPWFHSP